MVDFGTKKAEQPIVVQDVADRSQHNIPLPDKVSINIDTSITSKYFSSIVCWLLNDTTFLLLI